MDTTNPPPPARTAWAIGREMDAAVHRALGLTYDPPESCPNCGAALFRDSRLADECLGARCIDMDCGGYHGGIPNYSMDVTAAFQVLEVLRQRGHTVKIWMWRDAWRVSVAHGASAMAVDETAPGAICKAALQALTNP